jgi:hypothetical protein
MGQPLDQQDKQALTQHWDEAKPEIASEFPEADDADLEEGRNDPDRLIDRLREKFDKDGDGTGDVRQKIQSVAQRFRDR